MGPVQQSYGPFMGKIPGRHSFLPRAVCHIVTHKFSRFWPKTERKSLRHGSVTGCMYSKHSFLRDSSGLTYFRSEQGLRICAFWFVCLLVTSHAWGTYTYCRVKLGKTPMQGQTPMPFILTSILFGLQSVITKNMSERKTSYQWTFWRSTPTCCFLAWI